MNGYRKRACKVFTPEELFAIMPKLNGERSDAVKIGKENGLTPQRVDALRYLLGYSGETIGYKLEKDQKEELIEMYKSGGYSTIKLGKKFGLTASGVIFILKNAKVYEGDKRLWSNIKKKRAIYLRKSGLTYEEIAKAMEKSKSSIESLFKRMKDKGEYERNS